MRISSDQITWAAAIPLSFLSGAVIAKNLDETKRIDNQGKVGFDMPTFWGGAQISFCVLVGSMAVLADDGKNPSYAYQMIKVALLAAPILYSYLKKTQVLVSTSLEEAGVARNFPYTIAPYLNGVIKTGLGSKIPVNDDDKILKVNLAKNSFGITEGYLPETVIKDSEHALPLRLMYSGYPIEVIPKNFKCTHIRRCNEFTTDTSNISWLVEGNPRGPGERIFELEFGENAILKKGHLPERFIRKLTPNNPLELKYRGLSFLITMEDNCVNEAAPKPPAKKSVALQPQMATVPQENPLECERVKVKAKRAQFHNTPEIIVQGTKKATVVKPSVAPAVEAQIPAEENNGANRITQAARNVANSVEQLLSDEYNAELEAKVRAVINGKGSAQEKDEQILALLKA